MALTADPDADAVRETLTVPETREAPDTEAEAEAEAAEAADADSEADLEAEPEAAALPLGQDGEVLTLTPAFLHNATAKPIVAITGVSLAP